MARLYQSGFELNSVTTLVEWNLSGTGQTITAGAARSGGFGLRISSMTSATAAGVIYKYIASSGPGPFFLRTYLNIQTLPTASNHIISFNSGSASVGVTPQTKITLENNGTLVLRNQAGTQIGSASAVLTTSTWYMVELKTDTTLSNGSRVMEARLNGATFATSSTQSHSSSLAYSVGGNLDLEAQTTGEWWFDDTAVNDNTGSFQTGYPGSGKIIHLKPNAAGDVNTFSTQTGGTPGATNNFTRVNEIPPDNATTLNGSGTLNEHDLFNVENSGIGATDTVNVVTVGGRYRNNVSDAVTALRVEIEKTSGGTITQSADIIISSTGFTTNLAGTPHNYPITLYQDPDGANWTQTTLDSMQIGYKLTTAGTNRIDVTTVWAAVDYTPLVNTPPAELALLGVG